MQNEKMIEKEHCTICGKEENSFNICYSCKETLQTPEQTNILKKEAQKSLIREIIEELENNTLLEGLIETERDEGYNDGIRFAEETVLRKAGLKRDELK